MVCYFVFYHIFRPAVAQSVCGSIREGGRQMDSRQSLPARIPLQGQDRYKVVR